MKIEQDIEAGVGYFGFFYIWKFVLLCHICVCLPALYLDKLSSQALAMKYCLTHCKTIHLRLYGIKNMICQYIFIGERRRLDNVIVASILSSR